MSNETRESKRTTKEKAAAARAAAEAEQRRRDRRLRIVGGIAIVVVVGLIIGLAIWGANKNSGTTADGTQAEVVADAKIPTGVNGASGDYAWGVPYNNAAGKPTLAIWEDFQCPSCGNLERTAGANILKLADDGKINLIWRPTSFLDQRFLSGPNPYSSQRAAAAWGCAIDAGKTAQYHSTVFTNQPATEGNGWTNAQLVEFGKQAGVADADMATFTTCVNDQTYAQWSQNSYQTFLSAAVPGTPAAFLDGKEVPTATLVDAAALAKLVDEATSK